MICRICGEVETKNENGICTFCSFFPIKDKDEEEIGKDEEEIGKEGEEIEKRYEEGEEIEKRYEEGEEIEKRYEEGEEIEKREQDIGPSKALCFNNAEYNYLDPNTIWSFRQNIPELIVQDCIKEFNFDDEQAEKLRIILMARGVNKWMFARREFIKLKHQVKEMLKDKEGIYGDRRVHRIVEKIYVKMQNIARDTRWIEWPRSVTHKWKNIEKDIKKKGKHC